MYRRFGFIVGPSGVGKGYGVGSVLGEHHGTKVFVTGDWCRLHAQELSDRGVNVSDDIIHGACIDSFERWGGELDFFLDAPRSVVQVEGFIQMYKKKNPDAEIHTIHIEASKENCEARLKDRAVRQRRKDDAKKSVILRRLDGYFKEGGIRDTVVPLLRKRTHYHFVDGNLDLESIRRDVLNQICPKIFPKTEIPAFL